MVARMVSGLKSLANLALSVVAACSGGSGAPADASPSLLLSCDNIKPVGHVIIVIDNAPPLYTAVGQAQAPITDCTAH